MIAVKYAMIIVRRDNEVLLGYSKRGLFENKWTFVGGYLKREKPQEAVVRYLKLQTGLVCEEPVRVGRIEVKLAGIPELIQITIFMTDNFKGEIAETPSMKPKWFPVNEIPAKDLCSDVTFWLGKVLSGKKVKGFFVYQNEDIIYKELTFTEMTKEKQQVTVA